MKRNRRTLPRGKRVVKDISAWDHGMLSLLLASAPDRVLSYFEAAQVHCLFQLPCYVALKKSEPDAARRVRETAATYGIPERLERAG